MDYIEVYADGRVEHKGRRYFCSLGKNGVTTDKKEGDGATPVGAFRLLKVYFNASHGSPPRTILPVEKTTSELGWADDPKDPDSYSQPVVLPYRHSHEKLMRDDHLYDIVVDIDYNRNPAVPGLGSAIFIHLSRSQTDPRATRTAGCIAFRRQDLEEILRTTTPNTLVRIHNSPAPS